MIAWKIDLKQTSLTMGNAIVKLVKKVKKLERKLFEKREMWLIQTLKRKKPDAREEQVEDISPNNSLEAKAKQTLSKEVNTGGIKLSTVSGQVSTGSEQVSTVSAKRSTPSPNKGQRVGKAPMISEENPKKSKETNFTGRSYAC
ncbi:hypothetical protein Tco_0970124 [Tanacetum coccineum]